MRVEWEKCLNCSDLVHPKAIRCPRCGYDTGKQREVLSILNRHCKNIPKEDRILSVQLDAIEKAIEGIDEKD